MVRECASVSVTFLGNTSTEVDYYLEVLLIEDTNRIIICDNIRELIDICKSTDFGFLELYDKHNVTAMLQCIADTITEALVETCNQNLRTYIESNVYEYEMQKIHYTVHDHSSKVDIFSF